MPIVFTPVSLVSLGQPGPLLAYLVLIYSTFRLSFVFLVGTERLIEGTFWIFVYVFFGLAALAQTVTQRFALPPYGPFSKGDQIGAFAVIIVGLLAYELGRVLRKSRRGEHPNYSGWRFIVVPKRIWLLATVGIVAVIAFLWTEGVQIQFSSRQDSTVSLLGAPQPGQRLDQISDKAIGIVKIFFHWVPQFVALYLLLYLYAELRRSGARVPWITTTSAKAMLMTLVLANVIVNNPISNPRSRFGGVAMALTVAVLPLRRPARFRLAVAIVLLAVLFVLPLADVFRYSERGYRSAAPLADELVSSADYSMFQQELNSQVYVKSNGHTFGHQLLGSIFVFVPRRWWPSKPIATGDVISRTNAINASDSLWAEAYVDAGYVGVFGFFLMYGWVTFGLERRYIERAPGSFTLVSVGVPLFAAFQLLILRGALQPVVGELVPVGLVLFACSQRRRSVARAVASEPLLISA
jgi:hypothetical protein